MGFGVWGLGRFEDDLPEYPLDEAILKRYEAYGQGKGTKGSKVLPGARLGARASVAEVVKPLLEGLKGDPEATLATLRRMAAGSGEVKTYLTKASSSYPALSEL